MVWGDNQQAWFCNLRCDDLIVILEAIELHKVPYVPEKIVANAEACNAICVLVLCGRFNRAGAAWAAL